jgi:hypothetical protein
MMWMGKVSAWGALAAGALLAGFAALQFSWGAGTWQVLAPAILLLVGGFRTLRKMPSGLRLLAGAWGLTAGATLPQASSAASIDNPNLYSVDMTTAAVVLAIPIISLAGLALTVLHKER